jgi:integrase
MIAARNDAYERTAKRSDVRFVTMDDYRIFRDVGLRGLALDGTERPGARDRNGLRNALFADLLVTTGLRLEEASGLLADELAAIDHDHDQAQQLWLRLPPPLTKGDRGRSVLVPRRLLRQITAYVAVERAAGVPSSPRATVRPGSSDRSTSPAPVSTACAMSAPRRNDAA